MLGIMSNERGKIGWILLWALGVPIPDPGLYVKKNDAKEKARGLRKR